MKRNSYSNFVCGHVTACEFEVHSHEPLCTYEFFVKGFFKIYGLWLGKDSRDTYESLLSLFVT